MTWTSQGRVPGNPTALSTDGPSEVLAATTTAIDQRRERNFVCVSR